MANAPTKRAPRRTVGALELLEERSVEFDVVDYTKNPLSRKDFVRVLEALDQEPSKILREDTDLGVLGIGPKTLQNIEAVADLLQRHPALMQRPIGLLQDRAVVARPADRILQLLDS